MTTSSGGGIGNIVSFKSADAYSTCQYYPVKLTADNTVGTCSATTDRVIGILQNKPEAIGATADVLLSGGAVSKVITSGTIAAAGLIYVGTNGLCRAPLDPDVARSVVVGYALEASTATAAAGGGDIITAILIPSIGTVS
ncbi:MAG: hypothetical protein WC208_15290 [Gallionella sp.]|jgi:hypothetical protein